MDLYSRFLLQFLYRPPERLGRVETFTLRDPATRYIRLRKLLRCGPPIQEARFRRLTEVRDLVRGPPGLTERWPPQPWPFGIAESLSSVSKTLAHVPCAHRIVRWPASSRRLARVVRGAKWSTTEGRRPCRDVSGLVDGLPRSG